MTVFLDSIMEKNLQNDGRVVVQGFGSFKVNEYKAQVAKKPLTGELIHLPVRRKPSFHVGIELRQRVNEGMDLVNEAEALLNRIPVPENVFSISAGEFILLASGTFISVRPSCGILRLQDATPDSHELGNPFIQGASACPTTEIPVASAVTKASLRATLA